MSCFLYPRIVPEDLPYTPLYSNRVNVNAAGPSLMTISIEIERGFYGLTLASSSFSASYRHATFSSGSSRFFYLSIESTSVWGNCEDGARGDFDLAGTVAYRVVPIRFYSLLTPTWPNISLHVRGGEFIFSEKYKFQRILRFQSCMRTAVRNVARIIIAKVEPNEA